MSDPPVMISSSPRIMPLNQVSNHPPISSSQSTLSPNQAPNPPPISFSWTTTPNIISNPPPISSSLTATPNIISNPPPTSSSPRNVPPNIISIPAPISSSPSTLPFNQVPSSTSTVSPRFNFPQVTVIHAPNFTSPQLINEDSSDQFQNLSNLISQLHIHTSQCRRIQRGSPGAGSLSQSMSTVKTSLNQLKPNIEAVLTQNQHITGMTRLKNQYDQFDNVVNEFVNERGYDDGYTDRVQYLERLNFESGYLKGLLDSMIDRVWQAGGNAEVARTLTYSDEDQQLETSLNSDLCYLNGDISISIILTTQMSSRFLKLLQDRNHCDVTFKICMHRILAHRIVLAAQSEYFDSLLFGSMRESEENCEIELIDVSLSSFQLLLHYAYTGHVELNGAKLQGVLELMETADRFSFLALKDALANQLSSLINLSTVLPIYISAHRLELKQLQESCLTFSDKNAAAILQEHSLLTLSEGALSEILQRDTFLVEEMSIYRTVLLWMQENNVTSSSLLKCVRLSEIPFRFLVDLSEPGGYFSETEVLAALKIGVKNNWEAMRSRGRIERNKNLFNYKDCAFIEGSVTWKQVSNQETVGGPIGGPGGGLQPGVLPGGGGLQPGVFGGGPITGIGVGPGGGRLQPTVGLGGGLGPGVGLGGSPITGIGHVQGWGRPQPTVGLGGGLGPGRIGHVQGWGRPQPTVGLGGGLGPGVGLGGTPGLGHFTGGQGGGREIHGKPDMALSSIILSNSLSEPIRVFARTSQTARSPHLPEFVVALSDIHLLNYIIFDPYPEELTETIESLGFSYTLEISRDSSHWKTLINYTEYCCYGRQYIILPTIAVRYLRLKLVSVTNTNTNFTVLLRKCSFNDEEKYIHRENGILAPQTFLKAIVIQEWKSEYEQHICTARLRQPVSVKTLKFKLDTNCSVGTIGDITISFNEEKKEKTLTNIILKGSESEFIIIELPEAVILTGFTLKIINIINVQLPTSSSDSFKLSDIHCMV